MEVLSSSRVIGRDEGEVVAGGVGQIEGEIAGAGRGSQRKAARGKSRGHRACRACQGQRRGAVDGGGGRQSGEALEVELRVQGN